MQTQSNRILNPLNRHLSEEAHKRLRWLYIYYYECANNVTKASNKIGISRQWLSTIKSTFERHNKDPRCLDPRSKAPRRRNRNRIPEETEKMIIATRVQYPYWGKEKISHILKRDCKMIVHPSTVNRYLHKHQKINPKLSLKNTFAWKNKKQKEGKEETATLMRVKHRPPTLLSGLCARRDD